MASTFQSKGFICKTVSRDALDFALDFCRGVLGSRWAYAHHEPASPRVPHWHLVALFEDRVFWKRVFDRVMTLDPCSSTSNCKRPRKAVRYLLHLDSPEKHPVSFSALVSGGAWGPDELDDWLSTSSVASNLVSRCLSLISEGCSPLDAFNILSSEGFEPFQISAALQAYSRLCMFWEHSRSRGMGTLRRPHQGGTATPQQHGEKRSFDFQGKNDVNIKRNPDFPKDDVPESDCFASASISAGRSETINPSSVSVNLPSLDALSSWPNFLPPECRIRFPSNPLPQLA